MADDVDQTLVNLVMNVLTGIAEVKRQLEWQNSNAHHSLQRQMVMLAKAVSAMAPTPEVPSRVKRWHVVASECRTPDSDTPAQKRRIWTLSKDPEKTGWETDSGQDGYGLTYVEAKELADAANYFRRVPNPGGRDAEGIALWLHSYDRE